MLASALTKIHPGAGRSPGLVDLPVIKDPLGYPFIPGSQVKGALKTMLAKKNKCIGDGKVKCNNDKCRLICCLLGREVGEGEEGASAVQLFDLYPVFLPAPSAELGVVYVTSPALLSRASALLEVAGRNDLAHVFKELSSKPGESGSAATFNVPEGVVRIGATPVRAFKINGLDEEKLGRLDGTLSELHPLYAALRPLERILVLPEAEASGIVSGLLHRVTRVRLSRETKTVERGALWTEEYIPWGTLFIGGIAATGFKNPYCSEADEPVLNAFEKLVGGKVFHLIVGGKESIGGGLLKLKLLGSGGGQKNEG